MKIDNATLQVLKSFSTINKNIMFKPGNKIRTISDTKSVLATATVGQEFDKSFAIYDLSRFLGTLSLFNEPELDVKDSYVEISEGNNKFNYALTDPSLIIVAPDKEISLPDPEVTCVISEEVLARVMKALAVSQLPEIAIIGKDGQIFIQAVDTRGTTNDSFSVAVGQTNAKFRMVFRSSCMKLIPGNYEVSISSRGLSHWKGANVEYWIAVESNSTYEG